MIKSADKLSELTLLFLKLGTTAFGGPAAHIAMMEEEVVRRRKWLSREKFLDLFGATNLIPGPNSTEMAIHIGHLRAGFPGLIVAGVSFILPAMLIVMGIAWAYVRFGSLPHLQGVLYGVKPVIIAVVIQALWGLSRTAVKSQRLALAGAVALGLIFSEVNELLVLLATGFTAVFLERVGKRPLRVSMSMVISAWGLSHTSLAFAAASRMSEVSFSIEKLFLFFLKVGSVLYGSGYVLLAFLRTDLVTRFGWLTEAQLLDATAVGQFTPGPVFTTATFVGYVLGGPKAALLSTLGIFLPAFFFVAISGPLIPRIRRSPLMGNFLNGVNVASLALMAVVSWQLGRNAVIDLPTAGLAVASACFLIKYRINSAWLVLAGAALGTALKALALPIPPFR